MKSRKAISSVVGAVFAIIALSTTVGYVTYSMNILDQYNQSILTTNANALDRSKEQIQVTGVTIDNHQFNITANNIGNIPIHLTRLWVTNTTDVDKVFKYNIDYNLNPGQSQIRIGQSTPIYAKTTQAYDLKLITDRGNVKEFTVNSVGTAPLNIQLLAMPPSVASGFKTQLVMTVTNNESGTLTNLVPILTPNGVPTATCTPDLVSSPAKYNTLTPGSTAIFSWAVKVEGTIDGQTCKFGAQLQNGYDKNFGNTTITETIVTLPATDYAANAGIITIDYTSFRWAQDGTGWTTGWSPGSGPKTAFYVDLVNNNSTAGGTTLWLSQHALLVFFHAGSTNSATPFWIVGSVNPGANPITVTKYTTCANGDYCQSLPYRVPTKIYFSANADNGGDTPGTFPQSDDQFIGFIVLLGKFSNNQYGAGGTMYGQTIPFIGIRTS